MLDYDVENEVYPYRLVYGHRWGQVRGLIAEGLFTSYEEIRNHSVQMLPGYEDVAATVMPGDIKYKDVNGDGVVNSLDEVAIGATDRPNLIYGMGFSVTWRGFDFNMLFQGAGKSTFLMNGKCVYAFSEDRYGQIFADLVDGRYIDAETAAQLGIMPNEDANASYPRLDYVQGVDMDHARNNYRASTYWLRDSRYIRLKNVDLGYTLPKKWVNRIHFNNIRIYLQGSNLLTWSKFKLWDPEMNSSNGEAYPITKAITGGIQISL